MTNPSRFEPEGSMSPGLREATKPEEDKIMIRVGSAEYIYKGFWERKPPINISNGTIKFLRENAMTIMIAVPSETTANSSEVQEITISHEVGENSSSRMIEDSSSLVTMKNSFIKISNQHPGASYGSVKVGKIGPKGGSHSGIGTGIHTSTGRYGVTKADCKSYGIVVKI